MATDIIPKLQLDTRTAQADRVAGFLEQYPDSTAKEVDATCDTGCISKVLSDMPRMGYGLTKGKRRISCVSGQSSRYVRTYALTHRAEPVCDLFSNL